MSNVIEFPGNQDGRFEVALLVEAVRHGVESERLAELFNMPLPEVVAFAAGLQYGDTYPVE
jgi:hypothetical protein